MNYKILSLSILTTLPLFSQNEEDSMPIYELDPFLIESSPLNPRVSDLTQAWSVYSGEELEQTKGQTIGETLALALGVSQSYYGPNANRPIIRGLDGSRVMVLENGSSTFDVSAASVDHAVTVDPMLIDRIEILRGSSALLYGSNAIGGVVNTIDKAIPYNLPEGAKEGVARLSYNSVNSGWNTGGIAFVGAGAFSIQVNGIFRDTESYRVPSFTLPDQSRTETVANSHSESWTAGLGMAYRFDRGYVGASYSNFVTNYGVPNEEAPEIQLERQRVEIRGSVEPVSIDWLANIEFQIAAGDYRHDEVEQSGEIAATFEKSGIESRLAMVHSWGDFKGIIGFETNVEETSISGEENIFGGETGRNPTILEEDIQEFALFIFEENKINENWLINGGLRLETLLRQFEGAPNRNDVSISASGGIVFQPSSAWSISSNLNYTERQPEGAELYSDGPHLASGAFEVGNPSLNKETAMGIEIILRHSARRLTSQVALFYTRFENYISLEDTGNFIAFSHEHHDDEDEHDDEHEDDETLLAERFYRNIDAEFYGLEGELTYRFFKSGNWIIDFKLLGDVIWARNMSDKSNLPRTPPWRLGGGIETSYSNFRFGLNLVHYGKQKKTALGELPTDGYSLLGARVSYTLRNERVETKFFVRVSNLTNEFAKVHTSFLRDTAPLPGRSFNLGMELRF